MFKLYQLTFPAIESIVSDYAISAAQVEKMKNDMIKSFPYGDMKAGKRIDG